MERRGEYSVTLEDAYTDYKKVTKKNIKERLTSRQFKDLFNAFLRHRFSEAVASAKVWKLPYNLGQVEVIKSYQPKYLKRFASYMAGKPVWGYNDATGGYWYRAITKKPTHWKNRDIGKFLLTPSFEEFFKLKKAEYLQKNEYMPARIIV